MSLTFLFDLLHIPLSLKWNPRFFQFNRITPPLQPMYTFPLLHRLGKGLEAGEWGGGWHIEAQNTGACGWAQSDGEARKAGLHEGGRGNRVRSELPPIAPLYPSLQPPWTIVVPQKPESFASLSLFALLSLPAMPSIILVLKNSCSPFKTQGLCWLFCRNIPNTPQSCHDPQPWVIKSWFQVPWACLPHWHVRGQLPVKMEK